MKIISASIPEILVIEPVVFEDERGFFMEIYHQKKYAEMGIEPVFVQDNLSHSLHGTLRGLHYQLKRPQAKLIQASKGAIFDVAVDIRYDSPNFGKWTAVLLSDENKRQMFVPEGFAHGFCVLSETADVIYKCTDFYAPEDEKGILWSDSTIAIDWPVSEPLLSERDKQLPRLDDIPSQFLPKYSGNAL